MSTATVSYDQLKAIRDLGREDFVAIFMSFKEGDKYDYFSTCGYIKGIPTMFLYESGDGMPPEFQNDFPTAVKVTSIS